eukprot:g20327.t1
MRSFGLLALLSASMLGVSSEAAKNDNGLRGEPARRKLYSHDETKLCNSIGCPNGFQPIDKAWEVECRGGLCEVEQCCQAFCSSYPCPNRFQPISDASNTRCWDDDCKQEQCCQAFCSSYPCPNGFTPISYASTTRCWGDDCTQEQCCEAFCSYHPCPNGYVPIENAGHVLCDDDYCTTKQCCDHGADITASQDAALQDARKTTTVYQWSNVYDTRTSSEGGCDPNGCTPALTRDQSWADPSRWSCSEQLDNSQCKITYRFEEPQDIVRLNIKFYKGNERVRTLKIRGSGGFEEYITSSGTADGYEKFDVNTDETSWLSMESQNLKSNEWISITEVQFLVK